MKLIFSLILILQTVFIFSQEKWVSGYIININNDTIDCLIRKRKKQSPNSVYARIGKERYLYSSNDVKMYTYEDKVFVAVKPDRDKVLMEQILGGKAKLFELKKIYYLDINKKNIIKLSRSNYKHKLNAYMSDSPYMNRVLDTFHYKYSDIKDVVTKYNMMTDYSDQDIMDNTIAEIHCQKNIVFKINLMSPGLGAELKHKSNTTLNLELAPYFYFSTMGDGVLIIPSVKFQTRYYYNLKRRKRLGKYTRYFSGNYFALDMIDFYPNTQPFEHLFIGPSYGFQRNYKTKFYYNINFGVLYSGRHKEIINNITIKWGVRF